MPLLAAGVAYLAALFALRALPSWGAWAAAAVLAGVAAWAFARRRSHAEGALAAWPALHLLLIATGSLASPLVALAGVWAFLVARARAAWSIPAVALAGAAALGAAWVLGGPPAWADVARFVGVYAAGAALALLREGLAGAPAAPSASLAEAKEDRRPVRPESAGSDAQVTQAAMELVRRATDAQEAGLWRVDAEEGTAQLRARSAPQGTAAPEQRVALEGHPFRWVIDEQMPVHLQRGRRDLPSAWAAEMLLVPVDLPMGVLALAYPGVVPPGAEATALEAGKHLSALVKLMRVRAESSRERMRTDALRDAALTLPGQLELEPFASKLAEVVRAGLGAEGAAVALAPGVGGVSGRILHVAAGDRAPQYTPEFVEADSLVALSIKSGQEMSYRDLRRERAPLPLLDPGERWTAPPRSVAVVPLLADGEALGAVAAWHPDPARFGPKELELLRDLGNIAPPPLRGGLKLDQVEHRASHDALTGLANRATFEGRVASSGAYFDRYARPFSILILDVDHFKKFNDTHGHEVGDKVLKHVADLLRAGVRDVDLPARLGGEEFVVLMPETGLKQATDAAERIRRSIEARPLISAGRPLRITASFGVSTCPECTATPGDVLRLADEALYRAKGGGRNRVAQAPRAGRAPEVEI